MKKYLSITGFILVILYGFWAWNVYLNSQNCAGEFLCGIGSIKTLMPALLIIIPFDYFIKSKTLGLIVIIFGYIINILFYYFIGLTISLLYPSKKR